MRKITFKDIAEKYTQPYKDGKGDDINHITRPMYDVNTNSGELKVCKPNTLRFYLHPYNGQFFCQIGNPWINGIHYIVDYGEEDNNSAKGCIASNHILFLDKEDAKKYSIEIFARMRDKLNAKIEKVRNL